MTTHEPLEIGDIIIGEYEILDILGGEGKSGMGVVYLVRSRHYPIPTVLKTFQKAELTSIARFRTEAETWVSVGIHPNIVQAFYVIDVNEQLVIGAEFIAPDYYNRNTISDYLKQGGISIHHVIKWSAQFCYGMRYALERA